MHRYVIRRLLLMIPTLVGVAVLIFLLMRVVPGDIVALRYTADGGSVSADVLAAERARLGLDKPLPAQLLAWMGGLLTGDLGTSMWTGRPISYEISIRFAVSLEVAILATLFAVLISVPLGTLAALKQDTWVDYAIRIFSIAGLATPSFWLGIIMILTLLIVFGWLPPMATVSFFRDPLTNLSQLIWPALAVGYRYSAVATRMTRATVLEVLREDYVRTARAKGLWERVIVVRHAMRNAMLPVVTIIGLEFAFLIGGLVVTEQVFNLNGIGRLMVESIVRRDYTMTQALVLLTAAVFIFVNLAVDLTYAWLDPRIRYR